MSLLYTFSKPLRIKYVTFPGSELFEFFAFQDFLFALKFWYNMSYTGSVHKNRKF